jgi:uncharacterized protein (DUF3820 family)
MILPFGKYKGGDIRVVPKKYLKWLLANVQLFPELKAGIRAVLKDEAPPEKIDPMTEIEDMFQ